MTQKHKFILLGIVLLAIFFRFFLIQSMPGGLFPDEAANGLDINLMEQGQLQPFYERGNGREALFFYMLWGSVALLGKGAWQHHIVSALIGVISVLGTFLVTKQLFSMFQVSEEGKKRALNIALWAAFFMAVSSWHIVLSRTAFRAIQIPMFAAFTFYFGLLALQAATKYKRYLYSFITGAIFALGFYTYIAYRIMVPLIIVLIVWPILADKVRVPKYENVKKFFLPFITLVIGFALFFAPLFCYFYTHPGSFVGRSGQVSVFNPELNGGDLIGSVLEISRLSVVAYFWNGDLNWRHNISGEPFLSILISPFFAIGMILCVYWAIRYGLSPLKRQEDWKYFLLVGWFWSMLIPVITTAEGIPHGLRAVGTIPAVFIITVVGFRFALDKVRKIARSFKSNQSEQDIKLVRYGYYAAGTAFVIALILQSYTLYFVKAANSPENFYAFRSDLTPVSEYLKQHGNKNNTYLVVDKFSVQTVDYITTVNGAQPEDPRNRPYVQVDPEDSWNLQGLKTGDKVIFTQSSVFDIKKFKQYFPNTRKIDEKRNQFGQVQMAVYEVQ